MNQFFSFIVYLFLVFAMLFGGSGCAVQYSHYDSSPPFPTQEATLTETVEEPPPQEYIEPTEIVVVPSENSYVYMVPNIFGVYFFEDSWYRYYNGSWFRANRFNAPWVPIPIQSIPLAVINLPPEYALYLPPHYHHMPYHEFHTHWREWNQRQHWHQYDWYRHEMREDIQREKRRNIEQDRRKWHRGEGHPPVGFIVDSEAKKRQQQLRREQEQRQRRDQEQRQRQEQEKQKQEQQKQEQLRRDQEQRQRQEQEKQKQEQQKQEQLRRDQEQRQRQEQEKQKQEQQNCGQPGYPPCPPQR